MLSHTFAICAYRESPYLEACIRSLKRQTVKTGIILCTSTPGVFLEEMAARYELPLYIREGASDIQEDWNFAYGKADTELVTLAHQDDCYHKDYARTVLECWERYPDTTVFMTDCRVRKEKTDSGQTADMPGRPGQSERPQKPDLVWRVKRLLRLPLRFHSLCHLTWVKRAALCFGNPVICPSCTYHKGYLGTPLFRSPYKFALDWDTLWRLAGQPGRFLCVERPLICYRIHEGATTKACIDNCQRARDEADMYRKIWPEPVVRVLMHFYKKAYKAYEE